MIYLIKEKKEITQIAYKLHYKSIIISYFTPIHSTILTLYSFPWMDSSGDSQCLEENYLVQLKPQDLGEQTRFEWHQNKE